MKPQPELLPRDWEAISAYLDGALNPKDRAQLEARLQKDAGLRTALRELGRTRTVLRSQPRLRAPRNFTLTPQMAGVQAGRRSQPFAFPVLRLASVLATIFFVVALVGDLVARSAEPAVIAQDASSPVLGMGGGGGGAGGPGFGGGGDMAAKEVSPASEATALPEPAALNLTEGITTTLTSPAGVTAEAALPDREEASPDQAALPDQAAQDEGLTRPALAVWPVLRSVQILLALLALSAGLGAWYVRRSARR